MVQNWSRDSQFGRLLGVLKVPKNLAIPKKRGKIKATPFLNSFKVSESESEVRILIKILVLKFSKLMTLFVRNCTKKKLEPQVQFFNFPTPLSKIHKSMCKFLGRIG